MAVNGKDGNPYLKEAIQSKKVRAGTQGIARTTGELRNPDNTHSDPQSSTVST
ncbi:MAG: hypothetical protein R6U38_15700 [Desulfatiglandaceae bacterium]